MNDLYIVTLHNPNDLDNVLDDNFSIYADSFADAAEMAECIRVCDGTWRVIIAVRLAEFWEVD
jgi:hypothetical protein